MAPKSDIMCTTPKCIEAKQKYGKHYHSVVDSPHHKETLCERCGGIYDPKQKAFIHTCKDCGNEVNAGELVGLFVPHKCTPCLEKTRDEQRKKGHVCGICKQCYCDCCC